MKKTVRTLLTFVLAACCAFGVIACANTREAFAKPEGFAFDAATQTVTFTKVEGAESYSAVVKSGEKTVYENKELKENKIALADKKLAAGKYDVTVSVNATEDKDASETASYSFEIEKEALAAPAELKKDGDSVTWAAVEGATAGYSLRIYNKETNVEVLAPTAVTGTEFSTEEINEFVNAQTETLTYVIEVKAAATADNLESAASSVEWVVKGKILQPTLTVTGTEDGTTIGWIADTRATGGYKVELRKDGALVGTYEVTAGMNSVDIDRAAALKGQEYTVRVYGVATADLRQGDVTEVTFTQTLPALASVQNVAVNNYVVTWDKVAEATDGYEVVVTRKDDKSVVKLTTTVEQSDNPSVDVSNLTYAAEKDYTVSVTAKAVDGEYAASKPATADYTSGAKWNFAEADDKNAFASHGPSVEIENGALQLTNPTSGANVVRFVRTLKAGDKITITLNTKRIHLYGNGRKDNAAAVVRAFAPYGGERDLVKIEKSEAEDMTLTLIVVKDVEGIYMDLDGQNGTPVTIRSLEVEAGASGVSGIGGYTGNTFYQDEAGATLEKTADGLKMTRTSGSNNLVTFITPDVKAGSIFEVTYGEVTSSGSNNFFVYGINGNYDTYILNGNSVLRRNGFTDNTDCETFGGDKTVDYVVDADVSGLRFAFGSDNTSVVIKSIRVIEAKTAYDFTSADDEKLFAADFRTVASGQMTTEIVTKGEEKALKVVSIEGSNMMHFSQFLKAGTRVSFDIESTKCFVYGKPAGNFKDHRVDTNLIAETGIGTSDGSRHTVEITVSADSMGMILMFGDNTSYIYGITITPPQA